MCDPDTQAHRELTGRRTGPLRWAPHARAMTENDEARASGNRWEPTDGATPEPLETDPYVEPETAAAPAGRPTWLTRARAGVAAGAAAVLLAGGLGGFAIGRATAADSDGGRAGQQGVPT